LSYHFTGEASACWKSGEVGQTNISMDGRTVKGKCMKKIQKMEIEFQFLNSWLQGFRKRRNAM
jgi:hypothetical protein